MVTENMESLCLYPNCRLTVCVCPLASAVLWQDNAYMLNIYSSVIELKLVYVCLFHPSMGQIL